MTDRPVLEAVGEGAWPRTKAAWAFYVKMRRFKRIGKLTDRLIAESRATGDRELQLACFTFVAAQGRYLDRLIGRDRGAETPLEERIRRARLSPTPIVNAGEER